MDPHDVWLASVSKRASSQKRAASKMEQHKAEYQLLQPNGLRDERTGVGFGVNPIMTFPSVNLFSQQNLVEGPQAGLQTPYCRICYKEEGASLQLLWFCFTAVLNVMPYCYF